MSDYPIRRSVSKGYTDQNNQNKKQTHFVATARLPTHEKIGQTDTSQPARFLALYRWV